MDIKFDQNTGRILSCTIEGKIEKSENLITIQDSLLPADFLIMFPLGKYFIRNGEIIEKDSPNLSDIPSIDNLNQITETLSSEVNERK